MIETRNYATKIVGQPNVTRINGLPYNSRALNVSTRKLSEYVGRLSCRINSIKPNSESGYSDTDRLLLQAHYDDILTAGKSNTTRYLLAFSDVEYDTANVLEKIGSLYYSKTYQYIYSLSDSLDALLSIICGMSYSEMSKHIAYNCKKYSVDYRVFSRALTTQSPTLLNCVPLMMFLGLSDNLDWYIFKMCTEFKSSSILLHGNRISLSNLPINSGNEAVRYMLYLQITELEKYILSSILNAEYDFITSCNQIFVTSFGLDSIVINSPVRLPHFLNTNAEIKMGDGMIYCVKPAEYTSSDKYSGNDYFEHLIVGG
jgi:hypothetical protein